MRATSVFLFGLCTLTFSLSAQSWPRPYRIRVGVRTTVPNTPISADLNFAATLTQAGIAGEPDSNSILVLNGSVEVPVHVSDRVSDFGSGPVSWLVRNSAERTFHVYFDTRRAAGVTARGYQEPVGIGDSFHYNRPDGFDPLGVGMFIDQPVTVDWDGDGNTDLLQRNLYSYAYGQPYWGIFFWRNMGTNQNPKFDHYVRLKADGTYLGDVYNIFQLIDWDRDGNPDILYGIGGGPKRGTMRVYLNTGRRDWAELPVLTAGPELTRSGGGELNYGMRLLDWTGGAKPDLYTLRMRVDYFPEQIVSHTWFRHPGLTGAGVPLALNGITSYDEWPTDLYDWNGDGALDVIGVTGDLHHNPARTCVTVWENTGTRQVPAFGKPPFCAPGLAPDAHPLPTAVNSPAFRGLFLTHMTGWARYLEQDPQSKAAKFTDHGILQARGQAVSSGGYASVEVADWEGDGDLDFIIGNELGYVQLVENISQSGRTMFASPKRIVLTNNDSMRVARWTFLNDGDPEWNLGQSKPTYVDWDLDGDFDLLVGNNTNRIAYFENVGTRSKPSFAPLRKLTYEGGGEHFSFRKHPAVVDWNGDGLPDLVAGCFGVRERIDPQGLETVSLFERYKDGNGRLQLRKPKPLKLADGADFKLPIPYQHGFEVADWDRDGDYDVFTNERGKLYVYLNEGTNARPSLRRKQLSIYGEPIEISHHETSIKVVDWDKDGTPDLIAGAESGWTYFFRRAALDASTKPGIAVGPFEQLHVLRGRDAKNP
ncbi:MAG: VCBS repeat-containing protein [Bryobacterales bacterium]|nr:VCBS repeat-containing protein [Bryobacterales bacterium]